MEHINSRIVILLYKYINTDELDEGQKNELNNWIDQSPHNRQLLGEMTKENVLRDEFKSFMETDEEAGFTKLTQKMAGQDRAAKQISYPARFRWIYMAAAALIILFSVGAYFFFFNHKAKQDMATAEPAENKFKNDVAPGTEKAILTLADGRKISLDSLTNGAIAHQGNTVVMKEDGLLAYNPDKKNVPTEILYNTLTTPRGGEYRSLVLADGTKVWLNSVSSIRFPTAFAGKERVVDITGEVYFEVAKNKSMPFKVMVNGVQVEVLGTHFNINAYADEAAIKTTLLEGAIKIVAGKKTSFLEPGQQARVNAAGEIAVVNDADINEVTAWKNGYFEFQNASIETIMRQISRWYDVDVQYEGKISQLFIGKRIPRNVNVSALFEILESTGWVHFKIEGKKIIVKP